MRTLVIGMDSATWRIMRPLIKEGKLPNINKLVNEGVSGTLRSTIPPLTPPAWTSIVTGMNPGNHGIYDFLTQDRKTYQTRPVNCSSLTKPAIWDIFNNHNINAGIMNFPLAYPPPKIETFFISGLSAAEKECYVHPRDLDGYLRSQGYRIYPRVKPKDGAEQYFDDIVDITETQCRVAIELMNRKKCDLFWIVFQGLDWIQHYLWKTFINGKNAVEAFYCYMDKVVGRLLKAVQNDWNIIMLSDHGFREIKGEIHFNNILEEWGYLKRKKTSKSVIDRNRNFILRTGQKIGQKLPTGIRRWTKHNLFTSIDDELRELDSESYSMYRIIEWEQTKAFSYGCMGRIYIHEKGKYPHGTVSPGSESVELQENIIARLKSLKNPVTREPIVGDIYRKEEIYRGNFLDGAPDITFNPLRFKYMIYNDFGEKWFHQPEGRTADHDINGMFLMKGQHIRQGVQLDADVIDITPTILSLHGLPMSEEMDGRVLREIFVDDFKNTFKENKTGKALPIKKREHEFSDEEQKEIEKQLGNLGYL